MDHVDIFQDVLLFIFVLLDVIHILSRFIISLQLRHICSHISDLKEF